MLHEAFQMHICKFLFIIFRFFAEVSSKLQKLLLVTTIGNFTNDPIFHLFHSIHFWIWKRSKFIFMWSFWSILICKIHQFFAKSNWFAQLIILFKKVLENKYPEFTKNLYYVFSTHRSQIPIFLGSSLWNILEVAEKIM